jgi:hypothetical protein
MPTNLASLLPSVRGAACFSVDLVGSLGNVLLQCQGILDFRVEFTMYTWPHLCAMLPGRRQTFPYPVTEELPVIQEP